MRDNPKGRAALLDLLDRALRIPCPTCKLPPGNACVSDLPGIHFHPERLAAAKRIVHVTPGTEERT